MRLTEFDRLISEEFGDAQGRWIAHSHVISALGATAEELVEQGVSLRTIWLGLCDDFDVPEQRRLGKDIPGS